MHELFSEPSVEDLLTKQIIDLKMSLTLEAPDVGKCLKILTEIDELPVTPILLRRNVDAVQTIKKVQGNNDLML